MHTGPPPFLPVLHWETGWAFPLCIDVTCRAECLTSPPGDVASAVCIPSLACVGHLLRHWPSPVSAVLVRVPYLNTLYVTLGALCAAVGVGMRCSPVGVMVSYSMLHKLWDTCVSHSTHTIIIR